MEAVAVARTAALTGPADAGLCAAVGRYWRAKTNGPIPAGLTDALPGIVSVWPMDRVIAAIDLTAKATRCRSPEGRAQYLWTVLERMRADGLEGLLCAQYGAPAPGPRPRPGSRNIDALRALFGEGPGNGSPPPVPPIAVPTPQIPPPRPRRPSTWVIPRAPAPAAPPATVAPPPAPVAPPAAVAPPPPKAAPRRCAECSASMGRDERPGAKFCGIPCQQRAWRAAHPDYGRTWRAERRAKKAAAAKTTKKPRGRNKKRKA